MKIGLGIEGMYHFVIKLFSIFFKIHREAIRPLNPQSSILIRS